MSQTAITLVFEQWKAQQATTGEPVLLDEFVFALVPGLDPTLPVERSETLPPVAQIVHRAAVARKGVVNENSVVHSAVLGADVGDFSFNWIGLINKASGTLAMIVHAPEQQKLKTKDGQQGNVLTRSFLMEFTGAQTETAINTPAETWQIDFTARMAGMDERQRQENIDIYGAAAFFGDGWMVNKSGNQFFVTKGAGYVAGLRAGLAANQNITVTTKPVKVWLDVCWTGSLVSVWEVQNKVTVAANLADYVQNGVQHYVFALASIDANGNITDLRPRGSLDDQAASDALKAHEKSRNHPDATTSEKGFTQLSSETGSDSESKAATPKAVKTVNDDLTKVKETLGTAASKDVQTSKDDITAGRVLVNGSAVAVRSVKALPGATGSNVADANNLPTNSVSFVYSTAGNSPGITGSLMDFCGLNGSYNVQIVAAYNGGGNNIKFRTFNGDAEKKWNPWYTIYHSGNKPTAGDVGALPISGGTLTSALAVVQNGPAITVQCRAAGQAIYMIGKDYDGVSCWYVGRGGSSYNIALHNYKGGNGLNINEDGSIALNLANGKTFTVNGQVVPSTYANFDARYQPKGNYTPAGQAYTKAESDARYQAKGSYITGIRFGASAAYQERGNAERMTGGAMTSFADLGSSNYWIRLRPLQYQINGGSWVTAAYA